MKKSDGIKLDARELLGLSQVAKVSEKATDSKSLGRVLCKIGDEVSPINAPSVFARLLSKIGETGG